MNEIRPLVRLNPGEEILFMIRRHLFVFYARLISLVVLFFIPLFFAVLLIRFFENVYDGLSGGLLFGFFYMLWLIVLWFIFFLRWTDYYLDVWIVTNMRVIDIEHKGIFNSEVSTFRLEEVRDVTVEMKGVVAAFLKFGTVTIHTAGEGVDFIIKDAAHPLELKESLLRAQGALLEKHPSSTV
ncbi:MAG: PH domain-containing protein [Patescibacteria group bacterium]